MLIDNSTIALYTEKVYTAQQQDELDRIAQTVQNLFKTMTGGRVFTNSDTPDAEFEYMYCVDNEDRLYLPSRLTAVVTLEYLSDADPETFTEYTDPYLVRNGYIDFRFNVVGEFKLTYKAEIMPEDVKQALIEWAMLIFTSKANNGKQTNSEARGTSTNNYMMKNNLPVFIQQVIEAHKIYHV